MNMRPYFRFRKKLSKELTILNHPRRSLTTFLIIQTRKFKGRRNLFQEALWQHHGVWKMILKYIPININDIIYKCIRINKPGLQPLPKQFYNNRIRLWHVLCYRGEYFRDYLNRFYNYPEIKKFVDKMIKTEVDNYIDQPVSDKIRLMCLSYIRTKDILYQLLPYIK